MPTKSTSVGLCPGIGSITAQARSPKRSVGQTDDGDILDVSVLEERLLDLDDGDVLATADHDVLGSAGERTNPSLSIDARSPVSSHPSASTAARVNSGRSK